ncbi:Pentatricopeptide repeat [Kalmanozyma brasiliensis GHG001]|uniref:Pentacotripeptide-repeat region of PRORP domain-containing protein n=1 Tax=Kalmanozyma brasiliensis (strain GHG001) TaxID=1365824 RepID=V5E7J6_KALBG|nr:Pentatricopeptide repeat [Kalmanozyma brasiliensis GHG001]EST06271.1 Pentatricopeptide repeat [Kalmanozyma brasiliensis GHG001]
MYQEHAHKEALPLATRVAIANWLAIAVHLFSTNQVHVPTIKALRYLYGRRLHAIAQDCQLLLAQRQTSQGQAPPSILRHSNFGVALLEPLSVALQSQPIAALKLMDEALLRCRPDIYKYQTDAQAQSDCLSPIHLAMLTVMDSVDFQINCRINPQELPKIVGFKPKLSQDNSKLAEPQDGLLSTTESSDPIKDCLDWFIDSPHAFLLSHSAFKNARTSFLHCLSQAKDPHRLLDELQQGRDAEQPGFVQGCGVLLRSVLRKSSEKALEFYDDLWSRGVPVSPMILDRIIQGSGGQAPSARLEALFHRITNSKSEDHRLASPQLLRTVTIGWAKHNRADRVTLLLAHLKRRNLPNHDAFARTVMIELAASRGDLHTLHDRLAEHHDFEARHQDECAKGKRPLDGHAYGLLLKACNRADDVDLAESYLTQAIERGVTPRSSDFNLVIDMHVRRTNIDAALAIFDQMKEFGAQPDKYTYTILIHGFTLRRDPDSAAHALRAMIAAGKIPDRITYAALLNCFVESGLYEVAIRLFAWMQNHGDVRLRPTIEVCNIILKAYVLSSLPVQKVMKFVDSVRKLRLVPNANTYALMLQSACDAGLMDVAEEVFSEAEAVLPDIAGAGAGQGANIYHFTIMIHGYLRLGDHQEAKDYFDEMQSRKLAPSAITWGIMVHSYALSENEANYDLACNLVSQLIADEAKKTFRPTSWNASATRTELAQMQKAEKSLASGTRLAAKDSAPFETLYTVLMVAQARRGEPEKVESTLKTMARHLHRLSVPALTPLLDAYRRAGDIDAALQLFEQIYATALEASRSKSRRVYAYSRSDDVNVASGARAVQTSAQRRQDASSRNMICLPVSIMIDLLSAAGRHEEVAKIWTRAKNDGFGFDSDNWNHLVISMARGGQLEEALSVVEHVLYRDPPNAWMRSQLSADKQTKASADAAVEAEADRVGVRPIDEDVSAEDDLASFDPLPADSVLDPASAHGPDTTGGPSSPPKRRHEGRTEDDPYVELPFDRPSISEEADSDLESDEPRIEPSAFYIDPSAKLPLARDLAPKSDSFSPWYAHHDTMEAISSGLAEMREARHVIRLLDKFRTAASLLDLHERKVEILRERQKEEAVRSARDLIDGRG